MGIGAWWHWLVVLLIVVLVFGTKKLRNIGSDVGGAVKNFKEAVNEGKQAADVSEDVSSALIEDAVTKVPKKTPTKKAVTKTVTTASAKTQTVRKAPAKAKAPVSEK